MTANLIPSVDPLMDTESLQEIASLPRYVRFGPFQIDRQRQQVYRGGSKLRLQGKVYQVLLVLIHNQGEVVSREQLKHALWPADTHVNYDANVNTTVNKLRQALGESTEKPTYIETIPRRGYSFIGTAEFSAAPFPQETRDAAAAKPAESGELPGSSNAPAADGSRKWLTLVIIGLILAGILLGAGAATLWLRHFSPQLRH
ncbi:MAG TPA: winged helix-turn-helix domain-containing protein [Candidatus Acidoferrum sp.]|nr:winged helix-turn-helix domain-containing protein [Candidatus Acidoferrum sp.]